MPLWLDTPMYVALHSCTYVDTHLYVDTCESKREANTRKIKNSHILQRLVFLAEAVWLAKSCLERPCVCACVLREVSGAAPARSEPPPDPCSHAAGGLVAELGDAVAPAAGD